MIFVGLNSTLSLMSALAIVSIDVVSFAIVGLVAR